jgi:hypothetical protein
VSNAREQIALRNALHEALTYAEIREVRWHTVIATAIPAIERGWTGNELARWALGDIGPDTDNVGASIVTTLKQLGEHEPPRDITPTPQPMSHIQQTRAQAIAASSNVDHTAWANRIRAHAD